MEPYLQMIVLGVTGSIAMGKSTVAAMLSTLNIPIHDADKTVHKLFNKNGEAYHRLVKIFPEAEVADGIDRAKLGQEVFGKPAKLKQLENLLHPLVRKARDEFIKKQNRYKTKLIILDVPLLYETGGDKICDKVLVVSAPFFIQRQRALSRKGMTQEKFFDILKRQLPDHEKRKRADFILPTGLGKAYTYRTLKRMVRDLKNRAVKC
tara:strand:+ start:865 stop:1485 length:621 start_codon:yes stop_codon:yes gene_type:complete